MEEGITLGFVMVTLVLTIGSIAHAIIRSRRDRRVAELRTEMQGQVLDKFESSNEALEFLRSEVGVAFAASNTLDRSNATARMLGSLQIGIVGTFVGIGLFLVRPAMSAPEAQEVMLFLGAVLSAIGLGFVVSSLVGLYVTRKLATTEQDAAVLSAVGSSQASTESA